VCAAISGQKHPAWGWSPTWDADLDVLGSALPLVKHGVVTGASNVSFGPEVLGPSQSHARLGLKRVTPGIGGRWVAGAGPLEGVGRACRGVGWEEG
jgi:hypothetical protein